MGPMFELVYKNSPVTSHAQLLVGTIQQPFFPTIITSWKEQDAQEKGLIGPM